MADKLTDTKIKALPKPEKGQVEHADSEVPGLRVRIGTSGAATFIVRKRLHGRILNVTLGRFAPGFGIKEARIKARSLISDIEVGKPIEPPKSRGPAGRALRVLLPDYLKARQAKRRSIGEVERVWRTNILPALGDRLVEAVTRKDVRDLVKGIAVTRPTLARNVRAELSAFYGKWALNEFDEIAENPCRDAWRPEKSAPRERVLDDAELGALWTVCGAQPWPWGPGLRLLIMTGARRNEVFGADRSEFDLAGKVWTIPGTRTKNGRDHIVPLSELAIEVFKALPAFDESPKLFPVRKAERAAVAGPSGFSRAAARIKAALDEALEREAVPQWQLHDIRRTVATGLQKLGIRVEVTEAVLNHVSGAKGGIAGVYQVHDWKAEKRTALDAWAAHVLALVDGAQAGGNVVKLGAA